MESENPQFEKDQLRDERGAMDPVAPVFSTGVGIDAETIKQISQAKMNRRGCLKLGWQLIKPI